MSDLISRDDAINALWKALYEYEDETEKQFQDSEELDVNDWILHRIFVQNMSDIDRKTIFKMPSVDAEPVRHGRWQVNEMFDYKDMTCLSCGWLFEASYEEEWNYCPHCGAKMDEEETDG